MTLEDQRLHDLSFGNEKLLMVSDRCGCYYCGRIYKPAEIKNWVNDKPERTAVCPYCGIDSVLQDATDGSYRLDEQLLMHMRKIWFGN